ncbi:ISL3 family transposase [Salibacterium qingdaonense]|uniref:Transposase n=1 Tax=Salibacterium qingdaonense TaxID=266892 RepID=A0A1I4Q1V1_9BACI|nr:ISL3 family transposase [Salibacterium qingdaonense]SFM33615.1 Transposase [Salibacterium qingdaonense]
MITHFIKELLHLPAYDGIHTSKPNGTWVFHLSPKYRQTICPVCGSASRRKAETGRFLRHTHTAPTGIIWIRVPRERRTCTGCGATFTASLPDLPDRGSATEMFQEMVVQACIGRSIADGARTFGLPYTTLERWFYRRAPALLTVSTPTVVTVDDFAFRKGHTYGVAAMDWHTGQVLAIGRGRSTAAIAHLLDQLPNAIDGVVTDGAPAMAQAVHHTCPDADHILDRFHLLRWFTEALARRRRYLNVDRRHHGAKRRAVRLLSRPPESLGDREREEVRGWCRDGSIRAIYQALQHLRYVLKSRTWPQARYRMNDWKRRFLFHPTAVIRDMGQSLLKRENGVLAAAARPESNGAAEGTNHKIKLIQRRGHGYRNFAHLSLRIRLETGNRRRKLVKSMFW